MSTATTVERTDYDARVAADLDQDGVWHRGGPYPATEGPDLADLKPPF